MATSGLRLPGELDWVEGPIVEGRLLCKGCDKKLLLTTIGKHVEKMHCVDTKQWLCVKDAYIAKNIAMGRPVVASADKFERAWNAHVIEKEKFEEAMSLMPVFYPLHHCVQLYRCVLTLGCAAVKAVEGHEVF